MREHILHVAERLFYAEGIRAVGIDRLIAEADIAKATLYRHFSTKDQLVEAYLQTRHDRGIATLTAYLEADTADPAEQMLKIFDFLHERASSGGFRGCAFLIAVAESEASEAIRLIATEHKIAIRDMLEVRARALTHDHTPLAQDVALCYEGALALIAVFRDATAALAARRSAKILIEHYSASRRQSAHE